MHRWALPLLSQSLSGIDPDDWNVLPADTNLGEAEHHNTNIYTGKGRSFLEAIETYVQAY